MRSFEMDYDEGIALYDQAIDDAEAEVLTRGLPISSKPQRDDGEFASFPRMPADLSQTTFPQLQKLIGQFTAWFGYAIGQLKLSEGARNTADKQRSFAWSSLRKLRSGTVSDKDDAVRTDSRYMKVDAHYEHCDAKTRIYGAIVDGLKRDIDTVSRAASVLEARTGVEGKGVAISRRGRSEQARSTFRSGRRGHSAAPEEDPPEAPPPRYRGLDTFRKKRKR